MGHSKKSVCHNIDEVKSKVNELMHIFNEIIIEEYIKGIDIANYLIGSNQTYYINDIIMAKLSDNPPYAV